MAKRSMLEVLRLIERVLTFEADYDEKVEMVRYAGHKVTRDLTMAKEDVQFWAGEAIGEAVKEFGIDKVAKACADAPHGSLGSVELVLRQSGLIGDEEYHLTSAVAARHAKGNAIREIRPGYWERVDGSATAERFTLNDTNGSWWGWIVRSTTERHSYSDPLRTKKEALDQLRAWGT
jgi:hypothetical protein